ncbi:MAG: hypothetical protein K0U39_07205 [Alphaproteobacteria bacterium]|nr:hypothetical protein [Alphaproteobacteria bacterium]
MATEHKDTSVANKDNMSNAEILPPEDSKNDAVAKSHQIAFINFVPPDILKEYKDVEPELVKMFIEDYKKTREHKKSEESIHGKRVYLYSVLQLLGTFILMGMTIYLETKISVTIGVAIFGILFRPATRLLTNLVNKLGTDD